MGAPPLASSCGGMWHDVQVVLRAIGLVKSERRGYHIHYFINRDVLEECCRLTSAALSIAEPSEGQSCLPYCPERKKVKHAR